MKKIIKEHRIEKSVKKMIISQSVDYLKIPLKSQPRQSMKIKFEIAPCKRATKERRISVKSQYMKLVNQDNVCFFHQGQTNKTESHSHCTKWDRASRPTTVTERHGKTIRILNTKTQNP